MHVAGNVVKKAYVFLFARKVFYPFNLFLYKLSMRGLGILNYENENVSGEKAFIKYLLVHQKLSSGVIFDVGANIGHYSVMLRKLGIHLPVFAFEPHPVSYRKLALAATDHDFTPIKRGMGDCVRTALIYDYPDNNGSEHATLYREVIEEVYNSESEAVSIELTTVDEFVEVNRINRIALLKIHTEGHELHVLKGATRAIRGGLIDVVQVEFNEMNVISRTFLRDILNLLPGYDFYRLLPDGLQPLGDYKASYFEIFAFQNIVALKRRW